MIPLSCVIGRNKCGFVVGMETCSPWRDSLVLLRLLFPQNAPVMVTMLLFTPKWVALLLDIFILDVFKSGGALFIYFYCCVTEWPWCVWTCACLFVSRSTDLSALRAPRRPLKALRSQNVRWPFWSVNTTTNGWWKIAPTPTPE